MKKIFFGALVLSLSLVSCKKDQQSDQLIETQIKGAEAANSGVVSQEDLIREAKAKPITNLVLSENHFDFKDIKKGEKVEHTYEVTNTGKNPLIISSVKPGCGCTTPKYTKDPILPGQKGTITLGFDSSNFDGAINKQAEVYANVDKAPILITFSGNVIK